MKNKNYFGTLTRTSLLVFESLFNLCRYLINSGQAYVIPFILVIISLALLLFFLHVVSPLAPFVYSLF